MKLLFLFSVFLHFIVATASPQQQPENHGSIVHNCRDYRTVSKELFLSLEELSRIVDITYCVGTTGVYKPFQCLGRCHEFEGFELVTTWNTGPLLSDSCGFLVLSHPPWPKRIIIGFRGTYSISNTIVDLSAIPQVYIPYPGNKPSDPHQRPCTNCTVHVGFMQSWLNARNILLHPLEQTIAQYPDYQLVVVGHSLGGAVAAVAGLEFQIRGWQPQVTTFGEPKVGNRGLVEYLNEAFQLSNASSSSLSTDYSSRGHNYSGNRYNQNKTSSYHRVTHINDPVPLLPLTEWGYRPHAGEIYISKSDLPPNISDLCHCIGDADPECIAGSEVADEGYLRILSSGLSKLTGSNDAPVKGKERDEGDSLLAAQQQPLLPSMVVQVQDDGELSTDANLIPARYRLWELLFSHRDYFWRLGVCLPSPNWEKKGPGWRLHWKWPLKWKLPWKSRRVGSCGGGGEMG
ncbi:hypothetical protein GX48_06529 [Paracoccidioides brasiliensis]|nr:hypothetical protein GX48_06529 [Paracoccidioides brasiliensis]